MGRPSLDEPLPALDQISKPMVLVGARTRYGTANHVGELNQIIGVRAFHSNFPDLAGTILIRHLELQAFFESQAERSITILVDHDFGIVEQRPDLLTYDSDRKPINLLRIGKSAAVELSFVDRKAGVPECLPADSGEKRFPDLVGATGKVKLEAGAFLELASQPAYGAIAHVGGECVGEDYRRTDEEIRRTPPELEPAVS